MKVSELLQVLNYKFRIVYISKWTGNEISYSDLARKEKAKLRDSKIYMIFPTNIPGKIEVVIYYGE